MPEFVTVTLMVILFIFVIVGCACAIYCAFALHAMRKLPDDTKNQISTLSTEIKAEFKSQSDNDEKIINMSTFLLKLADANNDLRTAIKDGFDAQTENAENVIEANVKISNQNAQVLMDVLVTLAQMEELILKGLGYTPSNPMDQSGLKDLDEQRSNYGAPPAPKKEEGLTFQKK